MSVLKRMMRGASLRSLTWTPTNPPERLLNRSYAGQPVTVSSALGLAPFYRGVQLLSGSVGMLPCKVYRDVKDEQAAMSSRKFKAFLDDQRDKGNLRGLPHNDAEGRVRMEVGKRSRTWQLLHDKPNPTMAADEFWALVESHIDTWGNAYVFKDWGPETADGIDALWPLDPCRIQVGRLESGERFYILDGDLENPLTKTDILHIRGLGSDGLVGYSPVALHRQEFGTAQARQEFMGRFLDNDATPGVTLINPNKLSDEAIKRIKGLWEQAHKGVQRKGQVAVLGEGMTVQQMTMPLRDAQYIEGQQMDATTQALILGIPPYKVAGLVSNSMTYATIEAQSLDFYKDSLAPRLVRIQNAVTWDEDLMPSNWFAEFETGALLRATTKERYDAYAVADWMTDNEKREKENLPPVEGGDVLKPKQGAAPAPRDPAVTVDKPADGGEDNK